MYYVSKRMEIAGSHNLNLPYNSKCSKLHGHNWIITVYCKSRELTDYGMVIDFTQIKEHIQNKLDHQYLNELFDFNPTAENIAKWVAMQVTSVCPEPAHCYRVEIQESEGNIAVYERDE